MLDFFFFFFFFCVARYRKNPEKNNKICFNVLLILSELVKLAVSEYIFMTLLLRCNLALWRLSNNEWKHILWLFSIPDSAKKKKKKKNPTWRLWIAWLAQFGCCDVTWKPSIYSAYLHTNQSENKKLSKSEKQYHNRHSTTRSSKLWLNFD